MSRPTLLQAQPPPYSGFGLDFAPAEALASSPFERGRVSGGGIEVPRVVAHQHLPYRQSSIPGTRTGPNPTTATPTQPADVPAPAADYECQLEATSAYHPTMPAANQRSNAAPLSSLVNHQAANVAQPLQLLPLAQQQHHRHQQLLPPSTTNHHPLQLSAASLHEFQRRELVRRKYAQERERERARARRLSRAIIRAAPRPPSSRHYTMEGSSATAADIGMSEEELAEMQKLSENFAPEITVSFRGPVFSFHAQR